MFLSSWWISRLEPRDSVIATKVICLGLTFAIADRFFVLVSALALAGTYAKSNRAAAGPAPGIHSTGSLQGSPAERLERLIRLQPETADAQDEYLISLLSEDATRMAMLDLIFRRKFEDQQQPGGPLTPEPGSS
jgi:hypothetical protein